jgi:hypothetical protein
VEAELLLGCSDGHNRPAEGRGSCEGAPLDCDRARYVLVAGIAGGVGARLAMRVVALTDSDPGTTFTPGGTFGIVLVAVVLGAVVVAIYSLTQRYIRGSRTRKGLVLASVLVVFPGLLFVAREALSIGRWWLNVPLFLGVDLLYALVISFTYAWLDRALARPGRSEEPAMA